MMILRRQKNICRKVGGCALLLLFLPLLQACAVGNAKTAQHAFDPTLVTGSLNATSASGMDNSLLRDQQAVHERVVALADVDGDGLAGGGFSWENSETGSRGTISALHEEREDGRHCHSFKTTREAFDGVMIYDGKICQTAEGIWALNAFNAQ